MCAAGLSSPAGPEICMIDLYTAANHWQVAEAFSGLSAGNHNIVLTVLGISLFGLGMTALADETARAKTTKVAFAPSERVTAPGKSPIELTETDVYVFSAVPAPGYAEAAAMYQPIAEYLSRVTGKHFVYRHSGNWLSFSKRINRFSINTILPCTWRPASPTCRPVTEPISPHGDPSPTCPIFTTTPCM